jgi:hypothetical protein
MEPGDEGTHFLLQACLCFAILEGIAVGHNARGEARRDLRRG